MHWRLSLQNSLFLPLFPELANSHSGAIDLSFDVPRLQQLIFPTESEEVCEQRVEVGLGPEVQDSVKVGVVDVCENAKELPVDSLDGRWERGMERMVYGAGTLSGREAQGLLRDILALWGNTFSSSISCWMEVTT